ncbi:RING finger protein 145-like [Saccostrea echinata]|uniref:RING finger protein 145-like n=1 Tax=Saccostrea echinata TaxID=191078 RepID=UPI002A8218D5|nr:RING finger protein 145-like [Saccostrea echinata]
MKRSTEYIFQMSTQLNWVDVLSFHTFDCSNNPLGLFVTCMTVSLVFNFLRFIVNYFLHGWKSWVTTSDNKFSGTEGLTMFLMCIKFGDGTMKYLDLQQRSFIIKSSLLYATATFLNSTYKTLDPSLMSFSTIPITKSFKHFRILTVYFIIAAFPLYIVYILYQSVCFLITIPVLIMCVSTSFQASTSVATYALYILSNCRKDSSESLDDTVYCIRTTVKMIDFLGSVFLACIGVWVIITEGLNWIQTPLLILHCFDNVWRQLQYERMYFLLRKETTKNMNSLTTVNMAELHDHDDLCPICYQSMSSAMVTPCGHFYHNMCLKKWLYIKNTCPLCNRTLIALSKEVAVMDTHTPWYFPFCIQIVIGPSSI